MKRYLIISALALSACASPVDPAPVAPQIVTSSYGEKIPGRYALYVDGSSLRADARMVGFLCSAFHWPIDAENTFKQSVAGSLQNVFTDITLISSPNMPSGYDGMVIVRGESLEIEVNQITQFLTNIMEAEATIKIEATVDRRSGRIFGTSIDEDEDFKAEGVFGCQGGGRAVQGATQRAMEKAIRQLMQDLSNSGRLRS